jgi:hypothetical protein
VGPDNSLNALSPTFFLLLQGKVLDFFQLTNLFTNHTFLVHSFQCDPFLARLQVSDPSGLLLAPDSHCKSGRKQPGIAVNCNGIVSGQKTSHVEEFMVGQVGVNGVY